MSWINSLLYFTRFVLFWLITGSVCQLAEPVKENHGLLTVIQSLWNEMVPLLVGPIGRNFWLWSWSWFSKNSLLYIIANHPLPTLGKWPMTTCRTGVKNWQFMHIQISLNLKKTPRTMNARSRNNFRWTLTSHSKSIAEWCCGLPKQLLEFVLQRQKLDQTA